MKRLFPALIALYLGCTAIYPNIEKNIIDPFDEGHTIAFPGAEGTGKFPILELLQRYHQFQQRLAHVTRAAGSGGAKDHRVIERTGIGPGLQA